MKNIFILLIIISTGSFAQNTFTCASYISRQLPAVNAGDYYTRIDSINVTGNTSSLTQKLILNDVLINAVDYYNGYIWAWKQYENIDRSGGGGQALLKINKAGAITTYSFPSLQQNYNAATISSSGIYYNIEATGSGATSFTLNRINIAPASPILLSSVNVNLPANMYWPSEGSGDLIFRGTDMFMYLNQRGLLKINLSAGTSQRLYASASDTNRIVGSLFLDADDDDNIYGYGSNSYTGTGTNTNPQQNLLGINIYTGSVLEITTGGTQTSQSDGASCSTGSLFTLTVKGKVFNDANGNTVVNSAEQGIAGPGNNGLPCSVCPVMTQTYMNLTSSSNTVMECVPVNQDGTFILYNVPPSQSGLKLKLSTAMNSAGTTIGNYLPSANWHVTGENNSGTNSGTGDPSPDFNINLVTTPATGSVINQNFGIERLPSAVSLSALIAQPLINAVIVLNGGSNPPVLQGSDPEDQPVVAALTGKTVKINTVPSNAVLNYNNAAVTPNQVITSFNPSLLNIKITGATTGSNSISFQYSYIDVAGFPNVTPATYTVFWQGVLPVTLKAFAAEKMPGCKSVRLMWVSENEQDIKQYVVERSDNANNWSSIFIKTVPVNSTTEKTYYFTDNTVGIGTYYYRLRIQELNNTETFSAVLIEKLDCKAGDIMLYPNPVKDVLYISGLSGKATVRIIDLSGKTILEKKCFRQHRYTASAGEKYIARDVYR